MGYLDSSSLCDESSYGKDGKRCSQEGSHQCYYQSQVVYVYHVFILSLQGFVWPKYCFWPFLGMTVEKEMGVIIYMYLTHSPDYIDFRYMGSWSNSLGSSVFAEIPFLALLALHRERKRCGQVGPSPCYSQSEFVYAYQVLDL